MKAALWNAMLDAEFNGRYWRCVTDKYGRRDLWLKLFLAFSASGTVAGWGIWSDYPALWKGLSAAAAAASIAAPLLGYGKKVEISASHAGLWADLRIRYADLWERFRSGASTEPLEREQLRLRKIFVELEAKEPRLKIPEDQKIAKRCQRDVLRAQGIAS